MSNLNGPSFSLANGAAPFLACLRMPIKCCAGSPRYDCTIRRTIAPARDTSTPIQNAIGETRTFYGKLRREATAWRDQHIGCSTCGLDETMVQRNPGTMTRSMCAGTWYHLNAMVAQPCCTAETMTLDGSYVTEL